MVLNGQLPHHRLGASGLGSALAGAGAGGRGWQKYTGHSRLWASPGGGSQKAKVRVGLDLVWKVNLKLKFSLPTMGTIQACSQPRC